MKALRAVVIGAGFGGLAAAIRLQARGIQTTLIDRRDKPGGRAYVYEKQGYKFDGGPTVITAPFLIDNVFAAAGKKTADYVKLVGLDTFYRIYFHDGRRFDYSGDEKRQLDQISKFNADDVPGYRRFLDESRAIFDKGFVELGDHPFLSLWDMLKVAPDLLRLGAVQSVYSYVSKYFRDENLRRVFSFHPLLVGGSPFRAAAIYVLIHALEKEYGVHYALGGTGAIAQGMVRLFEELGGKLVLNTDVVRIEVDEGRAKSVFTQPSSYAKSGFESQGTGQALELECDMLINNGDVVNGYGKLVGKKERRFYSDKKLASYQQSMSLVVIYFGTKKEYPSLHHHNIILTERYKELIADIFKRKVLAEDFSLYLHMPTRTDESLAPAGCEACYVLAPVPHLDADVDWDLMKPVFVRKILQFLNDQYMPGLLENIAVQHVIDPRHFQDTLLSHKGNAFGIEPTLMQSAFFRPHNRSQDIGNLYLVGAGTQPGAGIPGVLLSAQITDRLIARDFGMKA